MVYQIDKMRILLWVLFTSVYRCIFEHLLTSVIVISIGTPIY